MKESLLISVSVEERLPEKCTRYVFAENKNGERYSLFYTKGREVTFEDYDDDYESDEYDAEKGELHLKEGWYESIDQQHGDYDMIYVKRENITHWFEETSVLDIIQKRLPSEEEIRKAAADFGKRVDPDNITLEKQADCLFGHKTGSEWLRDKLLKEAE